MDTVILRVSVSDPSLLPTGDLSALIEALSSTGIQAILEAEAEVMSEYQRANFASEGAVFGEPWPALSPNTIREKERQGFTTRPLIREGHLQAEMGQASVFEGDSVTTGIDTGIVPYARFQQATVGNKPGRILVAVVASEAAEMQQKMEQALDAAVGGSAQAMGITVSVEMA